MSQPTHRKLLATTDVDVVLFFFYLDIMAAVARLRDHLHSVARLTVLINDRLKVFLLSDSFVIEFSDCTANFMCTLKLFLGELGN